MMRSQGAEEEDTQEFSSMMKSQEFTEGEDIQDENGEDEDWHHVKSKRRHLFTNIRLFFHSDLKI